MLTFYGLDIVAVFSAVREIDFLYAGVSCSLRKFPFLSIMPIETIDFPPHDIIFGLIIRTLDPQLFGNRLANLCITAGWGQLYDLGECFVVFCPLPAIAQKRKLARKEQVLGFTP